jgi:hypothetical protein
MKQVEHLVTTQQQPLVEARIHRRVPVDFTVTLRWPGLRMADHATNLSEGGIGLETSDPLEPMTLVSLRLELPHSHASVDVLGRVVWTGQGAMGIRFESSDSRVFDTLMRVRQDIERI